MLRLFRWLFISLIAVLVVAAFGLGMLWYLGSRSLPDYSLNLDVAGLRAPIEIVRDANAVPHVFATSDEDALFGLGYAHAQDRLWQMTLMRRTAQGKLSEIFGSDTVETDRLMRALDIYNISIAAVEQQSPQTLRMLNAYAAGVNAWLSYVRENARGRGAPEFFVLPTGIAPWTAADSIAVMKLMALQMTDKAALEVLRAQAALRLDNPARLDDLFPLLPGSPIRSVPEYAALFGAPSETFADNTPPPYWPLRAVGQAGASNAWAALPGRTANQGAMLANDPHVPLTAPGTWMLARLELETGGVIGATIPGIPAILIGRSNTFTWGLTASYLDDQDLFLERVNPQNPDEYLTEDGAIAFETRASVLNIKDAPPITLDLRWTGNGPVIPGNAFGLRDIRPPGHEFSLSWTGLAIDDFSVAAAIDLMRANSVDEGKRAVAGLGAPSFNVVMADAENIAMVSAGRMPVRSPANETLGRLPAAGWVGVNAWQGSFPATDNPVIENPPGGIVLNTNNPVSEAAFPQHFSYDWGDGQRILRARDLLAARQFHTIESFVEIQNDTVSISARLLLPLMGRNLWFGDQDAPPGSHGAQRREALALLSQWNGDMSQHDAEPLIYAAWARALQRRILADELGQLAASFRQVDPLFLERVLRDFNGAASWCDLTATTERETCTQMASLALDDAIYELQDAQGDTINRWRWGEAHQAFFENPVFGRMPIVGWFANIWHESSGGDQTLNRGISIGTGAAPYTNVNGAGFRMVVNLSNPDSSLYIAATGQSGHILSRFYDDMNQLWRQGEYLQMSLDPTQARGGAVGISNLTPLAE
ncbi:penicillin acylase family protein [Abyssibius alkaniclasticus]|uniref:penicillin acylase family protein n=1 Tax=Abyssibius alkaniclasticus TaxID=2881234 RepID=UPI004059D669